MPWFNTGGSSTVQESGLGETPYVASGIPGYSTQAQAAAHPLNSTQALRLEALGLLADAQPGGDTSGTAISGATAVANTSGLSSVADLIAALGTASLWIRVAETALGILLIIAGVAKLTDAIPPVTQIARALA